MKVKLITRIIQTGMILASIGFRLEGTFVQTANAKSIADDSFLAVTSQVIESTAVDPIVVVEEHSDGVTLELVLADFYVEDQVSDSGPCQVFQASELTNSQDPGYPRLPVKSVLVGIPMNAEPVLTVLEAEPMNIEGVFDLCPGAQPVFEFTTDGPANYLGEETRKDEDAYAKNTFFPASLAELSAPAMIRSQRIVQVTFRPFQYLPASGSVRYVPRTKVHISFNQPPEAAFQEQSVQNEGVFEEFLADGLVNGESAASFRSTQTEISAPMQTNSAETSQPWVKLFVNKTGMIAVTYEALSAAGAVLTGVEPETFQVIYQGSETASYLSGTQDGSFGPGDQVIFFGQSIDTRYTDQNVFWLTWGQTNGKRMSTLSVPPRNGNTSSHFLASQHLETNVYYRSSQPDSTGDRWYWNYLSATTAPASSSFPFSIAHVDTASTSSARLRGSIHGDTAMPRHHAKISVNDQLVLDSYWTVGTQYDFDAAFPMSYLVEGTNTIKVELPRDGNITTDKVNINWFTVDFWQTYTADQDTLAFSGEPDRTYLYNITGFSTAAVDLYDVSEPAAPVRLTDTTVTSTENGYQLNFKVSTTSQHKYQALAPNRYKAPTGVIVDSVSNLKSTANGADYLLISHANFINAVQPLADWRRSQGMRVQVIDVQDIYDEFNGGVFSPESIHDFIAYAYQNWQKPAPQYVVLVGDGHFDTRNYLGTNEPIYIPALMENVDPFLGETASDNRFVTVSGADNLPDLMIGRLPVSTSAEATAVVSKVIAYEQTPINADWTGNALFVADNTDSAGDFYAYSDLIADTYLPEGYTPNRVYYGRTHTTASDARTAILDSLNQGNLIVNYAGHGNMVQWASENLFHVNSVPSLNNAGKLPVFAMMACLTGYFHYPSTAGVNYTSLAETLVKSPDRGSAASWGSTGLGISEGQDFLNRGLYRAIFYDGQNRIGAAALQAKLYLYSQTVNYTDLIDTFTLFGDPALQLNVRPSDLAIHLEADPTGVLHNGMPITYTLTYENIGPASAANVRIDDPLPTTLINPTVTPSDPNMMQVNGSRLTWEINELAPGAAGTITVRGIVEMAGEGLLSSHAVIQSPIVDTNSENNTAGPIETQVLGPTAIYLEMAQGTAWSDHVNLEWRTSMELLLLGFHIERKDSTGGDWTRLTGAMIPSEAYGSLDPHNYTFQDNHVSPGKTYFYRIEIVEEYGSSYQELAPVSVLAFLYYPLISRPLRSW